MGEEHKITAKDKLILTIVLITISIGVYLLGEAVTLEMATYLLRYLFTLVSKSLSTQRNEL